MKTFSWINCILGLWLIVAAYVFTYTSQNHSVTTQQVVMGVIIAGLGCWSGVSRPSPILSWAVALAGLITLVAPLFVDYDGLTTARNNNLVIGFAVLVLGAASALSRQRTQARSGT